MHVKLIGTSLVLGAIVALCGLCAARPPAATQPAAPFDETREPPLELDVEIAGQRLTVRAGEEFAIPVNKTGGASSRGRITPRPTRLFRTGELSFRYPSGHTFEYELDEEPPVTTIWTFDGNDNVIILTRFHEAIDEGELIKGSVQGALEQYDPKDTTVVDASIKLAGREVKGKRITTKIGDYQVVQEMFVIVATGDRPYVLTIQDMPDEDGKQTAETRAAVELLKQSFERR